MKRRMIGALLCACAAVMAVCSCATRASVGGPWRLVWHDEFAQKQSPDSTVWTKIERGGAAWNKYMTSDARCFDMRKGNVVLRGIKNDDTRRDTATYLTGGICTKGKLTFSDGLIEVRAKLQNARGAWPAIWMLPEDAPWPHGGEIDIMERLNADSIAYQTVHSHYTYDLGIRERPLSHSTGPISPEGYNVYAAYLHADSIAFYINGRHTFTYPRITTQEQGQYPFDRPYYLLIDMQLGGDWVGAVNPDDVPVQMLVDWVRFYKKDKRGTNAK